METRALSGGLVQVGEERAQFPLRILVMLPHGEVQGGFQQGLRLDVATKLQQRFPQENPRHHPVAFFRDADLEVRHGVGGATFGNKGLSEAEAEKFILRLPHNRGGELLHARGHASDLIHGQEDGGHIIRATTADGERHHLAQDVIEFAGFGAESRKFRVG